MEGSQSESDVMVVVVVVVEVVVGRALDLGEKGWKRERERDVYLCTSVVYLSAARWIRTERRKVTVIV